jgi:hypothetical protein
MWPWRIETGMILIWGELPSNRSSGTVFGPPPFFPDQLQRKVRTAHGDATNLDLKMSISKRKFILLTKTRWPTWASDGRHLLCRFYTNQPYTTKRRTSWTRNKKRLVNSPCSFLIYVSDVLVSRVESSGHLFRMSSRLANWLREQLGHLSHGYNLPVETLDPFADLRILPASVVAFYFTTAHYMLLQMLSLIAVYT